MPASFALGELQTMVVKVAYHVTDLVAEPKTLKQEVHSGLNTLIGFHTDTLLGDEDQANRKVDAQFATLRFAELVLPQALAHLTHFIAAEEHFDAQHQPIIRQTRVIDCSLID
jgi:hypothetical protein